eukprot:m.167511 g.167511  ORF g.167511 m.167511 type:complete len:420 (-) comp25047_c0_seq3:1665-2924(-)
MDDQALVATAPEKEETHENAEVLSNPALLLLQELLQSKQIGPDKAARLRSSFTKLHDAVQQARERETHLLRQAKNLNQELQIHKVQLSKQADHVLEDTSESGELRRELLKASNDVIMASQREEEVRNLADTLKNERTELQMEVNRLEQKIPGRVDPETAAVQKTITDLRQEVVKRTAEIEQLKVQREEKLKRSAESGEALKETQDELTRLRKNLQLSANEPLRISKQAEVIGNALRNVKNKVQELINTDAGLEGNVATLQATNSDTLSRFNNLELTFEQQKKDHELLLRKQQQITSHLEKYKDNEGEIFGDRAVLEADIRRTQKEIKAQGELVVRKNREKDRTLKALRKADIRKQHAEDQTSDEQRKVDEVRHQLAAKKRELADFQKILPKAEGEIKSLQNTWKERVGAHSEESLRFSN